MFSSTYSAAYYITHMCVCVYVSARVRACMHTAWTDKMIIPVLAEQDNGHVAELAAIPTNIQTNEAKLHHRCR